MHPRILPAILASALLLPACTTSRPTVSERPDRDPRWVRIDSLDSLGQYATALELTDSMLGRSRTEGDWRNEFRAWMYRGRFRDVIDYEAWPSTLRDMEVRVATAPYPLKQLLHSVAGEFLWTRYSDSRWEILERTNMADDPDDPLTWGQQAFMSRIIAHYGASIEPYDSLRVTPVGELGPLLIGDARIQQLRPTLFDLLAHRALEVFRNSETRLAEPAWRFRLDDPRHFDLFEDFAWRPLAHRDSTSWEFHALQLYQLLERSHLGDERPDALVDVTLARLDYVRTNSTVQNKDSLHLNALLTLRTRVPNDSCWSEITLAIARWHEEMAAKYDRLAGDAWKWEKKTARDLCDSAIARFPKSFGAINAANLKARLETPSLNPQREEAVLPDTPFKIALTYTSVKKVWLRAVELPGDKDGEPAIMPNDKALLALAPGREWSIDLPDDGDLNAHLVEIPVEGLPPGRHAIIISDAAGFTSGTDLITCVELSATRLTVSERQTDDRLDLLVLDRATGQPRPNVTVAAYQKQWKNGVMSSIPLSRQRTDNEGRTGIRVPTGYNQFFWTLTDGEDRLTSSVRYLHPMGGTSPPDSLGTFLFTDRAIYRPGQEILFKGIVTVKRGKATATKAGHATVVRFFDVNGELVDSVNVTTDAYGAFHGAFKAPTGALTGQMRIEEAHGSRSIQVEEYKRPTFEVTFDPVAGQPRLEENVSLSGTAKNYAGVPLDGAEVKWTVTRNARMPWWCGWGYRGLPWGRETTIASGTSTCDGEGRFNVSFLAQADRVFPRDADPTFHYTISASATDINGETQSGNIGLELGYRSIHIDLGLGEAIDRRTADSIRVRVMNLNGQEVDVPMDIRITKLIAPEKPLRERLWERPDRFIMTREEHDARFPNDAYADEADPLTWPRDQVVLDRMVWRAHGRQLLLGGSARWDVGSYLLEVSAHDSSGREVKVAKPFTLYDTTTERSGFVNKAFHVEPVTTAVEPDDKAVLLLSSALPEARVLMEVERDGRIVISRWFVLKDAQQRVELPVLEDDRGGFFVHLLCVERGRAHRETITIDVPWSNKDLKVQWMSFRDKLQPGNEEEWRLKIAGPKGEKVAAQLLAAMYDASLDHFAPHSWEMNVHLFSTPSLSWDATHFFGIGIGRQISLLRPSLRDTGHRYVELKTYGLVPSMRGGTVIAYRERADGSIFIQERFQMHLQVPLAGRGLSEHGKSTQSLDGSVAEPIDPRPKASPPATRSDFRETAFFLPELLTDRDGSIVLRFKTPDALTRWKVLGLAHTQDLKLAQFTREIVTQKPLMVFPNLPRFFRAGDRITLTAKINVVEDGRAEGLATLALFDPFTNAPLDKSFKVDVADQVFIAAKGESAVAAWTIQVPQGVNAVGVRITAASKAGPQSTIVAADGEEHVLPVLTDKLLVTESVPLWSDGKGTRSFTLANLKASSGSSTLRHQSLMLEYTPNPAWYAAQALPYLMEFPHECAEQVFSRYYADRLAGHIIEARPAIKQVFEQWKTTDPDAFSSALEKNPELKSALLAETPWVVNARNERERKQHIGLLFDLERMRSEEATALKKLRDMQLPNGAWPWWSGMRESRCITQHIVAGLGHLEKLQAADLRESGPVQVMLHDAVNWLDGQADRDLKRLQRELKKEDLEKWRPGHTEIHYLYARSFFARWPAAVTTNTAARFYLERLSKEWLGYGLQEQAMIALVLDRNGDHSTASLIMESLKQRATKSEELGMYWKGFQTGMDWWSFPAETHALMIEVFHEVAHDEISVYALRTHLLRLKRTTDWKTTKATAEACYALLLSGDEWLDNPPMPVIAVGGKEVADDRPGTRQQAGTGYFEKTWAAAEIDPGMAEVTVTSSSDKPSWGALHWQYFEQMDKVPAHESPFSIRKQVMLTQRTDQGARLVPADSSVKLRPGDLLTIRIELRTDRPVDYVHLKDLRAAGLEPTEALSGYRYQGGLGYYVSIRDASMNFFFDRIPAGTCVFEYTLRVTHAGHFSNGITTAQCMYAPEFSSHSRGERLQVGE